MADPGKRTSNKWTDAQREALRRVANGENVDVLQGARFGAQPAAAPPEFVNVSEQPTGMETDPNNPLLSPPSAPVTNVPEVGTIGEAVGEVGNLFQSSPARMVPRTVTDVETTRTLQNPIDPETAAAAAEARDRADAAKATVIETQAATDAEVGRAIDQTRPEQDIAIAQSKIQETVDNMQALKQQQVEGRKRYLDTVATFGDSYEQLSGRTEGNRNALVIASLMAAFAGNQGLSQTLSGVLQQDYQRARFELSKRGEKLSADAQLLKELDAALGTEESSLQAFREMRIGALQTQLDRIKARGMSDTRRAQADALRKELEAAKAEARAAGAAQAAGQTKITEQTDIRLRGGGGLSPKEQLAAGLKIREQNIKIRKQALDEAQASGVNYGDATKFLDRTDGPLEVLRSTQQAFGFFGAGFENLPPRTIRALPEKYRDMVLAAGSLLEDKSNPNYERFRMFTSNLLKAAAGGKLGGAISDSDIKVLKRITGGESVSKETLTNTMLSLATNAGDKLNKEALTNVPMGRFLVNTLRSQGHDLAAEVVLRGNKAITPRALNQSQKQEATRGLDVRMQP